ncbi:guanylate kinase [Bacillus sp. FJAT-45350]|uniref:guanylate kinase n=1 Tax=Bacillus sp. FJAT-45350 TaxID=2011014 RepID=UPI000BB6CF81|nr:guanylate kinase [Bacillus sp. FJAT-45350]
MGKILVLVGPSASGKTTIQNELGFPKIVTTTTRPKREGERSGIDYHFMTTENFKKAVENDEFVEYIVYAGNSYGSHKQTIEGALSSEGYHTIVLDIQGALKLKGLYPNDVTIMVISIDFNVIKQRLIERESTEEEIERRLQRAREDRKLYYLADHIFTNDKALEETIKQVKKVIE